MTEKDFINVNLVLLYSRLYIKIITILMSFVLIVYAIAAIFDNNTVISVSQFFIPLAFIVMLPMLTYFTSKKNFARNSKLGEAVTYEFTEDHLLMKGESFNSQVDWKSIYKVTHTKNWVLIWQTNQITNPIPRRFFENGELGALKSILERRGVKNNLK